MLESEEERQRTAADLNQSCAVTEKESGLREQSLDAVTDLNDSTALAATAAISEDALMPASKEDSSFDHWLDGVCKESDNATVMKGCVSSVSDTMSTPEKQLFQMSCEGLTPGELLDAVQQLSEERIRQQRKNSNANKALKQLNCWPGGSGTEAVGKRRKRSVAEDSKDCAAGHCTSLLLICREHSHRQKTQPQGENTVTGREHRQRAQCD